MNEEQPIEPIHEVRQALQATVKDLLVFVGNTALKHRFRSNVTGKLGWLSRKDALLRLHQAFEAFDELLKEEAPSAPGFHIYSTQHRNFAGYTTDPSVVSDESLPYAEFYPGTLDESIGLDKNEKLKKTVLSRQAYVVEKIDIVVEKKK